MNARVTWTVGAWAHGLEDFAAGPVVRDGDAAPSSMLPPALWIEGNPIGLPQAALDRAIRGAVGRVAMSGGADRLLAWSGTLADQLFAADPRTWMAGGWRAFEALCDHLRPTLESLGWTLCLQPHARHVLSDAKGCREFLARRPGQPFAIALSPATMLERSMLPMMEDHLVRMFESLGPVAKVVVLEDIKPEADGDQLPQRTSLGAGCLPHDLVLGLLRRHVPSTTPVVLRPERLTEQLAWLA